MAEGQARKQIVDGVGSNSHTLDYIIRCIYRKLLYVNCAAAAVSVAVREGIVSRKSNGPMRPRSFERRRCAYQPLPVFFRYDQLSGPLLGSARTVEDGAQAFVRLSIYGFRSDRLQRNPGCPA